jgi:hypothetical protein
MAPVGCEIAERPPPAAVGPCWAVASPEPIAESRPIGQPHRPLLPQRLLESEVTGSQAAALAEGRHSQEEQDILDALLAAV